MRNPESAGPVWFGRGRAGDSRYLETWRNVPLTYSNDQELDYNWNLDHYEVVLGNDQPGNLFQRAASLTLTNQFYPAEVMFASSDYGRENRQVQTGDRVIQRIRIFEVAGRTVLEMLTMNEVTQVIQEERRAGCTFTTTAVHNQIGEWTPVVEWRENGEVVLVVDFISRAKPGSSLLTRRFARRMQLRGHQLSINNFISQLRGGPRILRRPKFSAELLPVGLLAAAFLVLVAAALSFNRRPQ